MKFRNTKRGKYESRYCPAHRRKNRNVKAVLPLALILLLTVSLTVGGTLAFMQQSTGPVTNTFKAGDITYTLNLEPNAESVDHQDSDVTMPSKMEAMNATELSVTFKADKTPALTGYTFGGWYYDDECTELHTDAPGTSITVRYGDTHDKNPDANKVEITLYAKWTPISYEVAYDGNGATSGSMENSQHIYDEEQKLTENNYAKTGYTFTGWNTKADGSGTSYEDEASVKNLTAEDGATVTLYAQWKANGYKIHYDPNTGSGTMADTSAVYDQTVTLTENAFTKTGYTFTGWNTKADGSGTSYADKASVKNLATSGTVTLYAQWTPNTYTVVYNKNGDDKAGITGSTANSTHTYDEEKNLTENGYERTGYTFIGWNTKSDGTGKSYANKESVKNLTAEPNGTVTLYAQWGAKSYVIRYHENGGEGAMADQTIKYDVPTPLRKNTFTRDDYSFGGWALTSNGERKYIDEQTVVNLLESGTLDLYAVWIQDSHTVTFDYNGGTGTPPSIEVQAGKAYGQLPEYPVHPTKAISETEVMSYLFTGWYTEPTGGTRVYPSDIVNRTDDHTLYAHWKEAPTNNVIKNMTVKNNPDDNKDGVVDAFYVNLTCSSSFEKYNIPLENLVVGQKYKLSFTESNNATYGMNEKGYGGAIYGFIITPNKTLTPGSIKDESIADGGLIKQFSDRYDGKLNGPRTWETTFTAEDKTMYWTWDYGLILDGYARDYNYTNIQLVPVEPKIEFGNKKLVIYSTSKAQILNDSSSAYATNFIFDGDGYAETMYFPITGLTAGTTYTITFDHSMIGALINNSSYNYGCGISSVAPTKYGSYMDSVGATWISSTKVFTTMNEVESVTLTFKATGSTAYWVWNMANCSDSKNCTIDLKVTNFSAQHAAGGKITYYSAASNAGSVVTLDLMPEETHEIQFIWDGIDDTNMDIWYPVDEQYPVAGDSYELAFEPLEGYTMAEIITVVIDDVTYEVHTNGQTTEGTVAPVYDPEGNILTIPAELLTADTVTVAVKASAVAVDISITTEPEATPDDDEAGNGDAVIPEGEPQSKEITVTLNLTNLTAQGSTTLKTGADYSIVLTPDEGYKLPEVLRVEINGTLYEVGTDGSEQGEEDSSPKPSFDPATGTLTIPAALLGETTESVTITISAVQITPAPAEPAPDTTPVPGDNTALPPDNQGAEPGEGNEDGSQVPSEQNLDDTADAGDDNLLPPDNQEAEPGEGNGNGSQVPSEQNLDDTADTGDNALLPGNKEEEPGEDGADGSEDQTTDPSEEVAE